MLLLVPICGEDSHEVFRREASLLEFLVGRDACIDQERTVEEAVGMVIHEVTLQEEGAVLRHLHKRIPRLLAVYRIRYNCHLNVFLTTD